MYTVYIKFIYQAASRLPREEMEKKDKEIRQAIVNLFTMLDATSQESQYIPSKHTSEVCGSGNLTARQIRDGINDNINQFTGWKLLNCMGLPDAAFDLRFEKE